MGSNSERLGDNFGDPQLEGDFSEVESFKQDMFEIERRGSCGTLRLK